MHNNALPAELTTALAQGNCVVLLGNDPAGDLTALAEMLARECDYPATRPDRSFPAVALAYATLADRNQLMQRVRTWLARSRPDVQPLYQALAALPAAAWVDFGYDSGLQAALEAAGRALTVVVKDHELPYAAERGKTLLLKPYGLADLPETWVLTEDEHYLFERTHLLISDQLRVWAATQVLLWVGVDLADGHWQRLHERMTQGISPQHRREFALASSQEAAALWERRGVTPLLAPDIAIALAELARAAAAAPPLATAPLPRPEELLRRRPYKFLDYYTADDADLFFGRDQWIETLSARILAQPVTVLFGRSGVGKTSLLRAGVLPRLESRACWPVYARPGEDPLAAVRAAAEAALSPADRAALAGNAELGAFIQAAGARLGKVPVVVLDQVEECFTALAPAVQARWVTALARAVQTAADRVHWVLSLREDFAAELHEWAAQVPDLFAHTQRLTPLSRAEARQAIAQPPQRVGVAIEEALVERLLADLAGAAPDQVDLAEGVPAAQLQIVCDRLFQARDAAGQMTLAAYEALGGARRILADYVDFALAQLPRARRELAVALLKALVTGRETKLPFRPEEVLGAVAGNPDEKTAVLAGLVTARLVRSLGVNDERRYELAHEVLVEKVRSWIDATEQAAQTARDLLRQEREAWTRLQALPEREKVTYLHAQRENPYLRLSDEDLRLMLRAALHERLAPAYWTRRAAEAGLEVWPLLAPLLEAPEEEARQCALWALTGWDAPPAWDALRAGLNDASPRVRVAAHQALYHLGTPPALALLDASDDLCLVPAGTFTMGSEEYDNAKPVHQLTLDAYFVEKNPVTNVCYAAFIEAGGYEEARYWTRAGWEWARRVRRMQPAFWQVNKGGQTVVGVTWYEAWAYAAWAGRRLLTEAEWENAARGANGRQYLREWGDELEWMSSLSRPYPYRIDDGREDPETPGKRILRGGSALFITRSFVARFASPPRPRLPLRYGIRCGVGCVLHHSR
jgi:formylglycine-generating enzyme required for sulfatase activity